jgi:hypothetical protein
VVDALALRDLAGFGERAEQRQPAIADVIAAGAIVDEADHLVTELAVLEHPVGDHPSQVAGAGDENALETDTGAPPTLQQLAHHLARHVGEDDRQGEKERPDDLRHFVGARRPIFRRAVIGLHVQRRPDAEHHCQDAADQHGEEVVDARAAAAQPIHPLQMKSDRRQHRDERQDVDVVLDRRISACDRDEPALEADAIRKDERPHREQGVGEHVKGDQQAVVASYHRRPAGAWTVSSMSARICCR